MELLEPSVRRAPPTNAHKLTTDSRRYPASLVPPINTLLLIHGTSYTILVVGLCCGELVMNYYSCVEGETGFSCETVFLGVPRPLSSDLEEKKHDYGVCCHGGHATTFCRVLLGLGSFDARRKMSPNNTPCTPDCPRVRL